MDTRAAYIINPNGTGIVVYRSSMYHIGNRDSMKTLTECIDTLNSPDNPIDNNSYNTFILQLLDSMISD